MQVKTFEALTMKDAIKAVKTEFGQDAVILQTKEKFLDERTRTYEVIAAAAQSRSFGASADQGLSYQALAPLTDHFKALSQRLEVVKDQLPQRSQFNHIESSLEELKLVMFENFRKINNTEIAEIPPSFIDTYQQLKIMGIDENWLTKLLAYVKDLPTKEALKTAEEHREYMRAQAIRWMLQRVHIAPKWVKSNTGPLVHAFVGATGVGKSAVVAKLAAQYTKQHHWRVLIVSHDQQRLASNEQMRVYCKILNIPFTTIESIEELPDAIGKHAKSDLILIDTAGRSPKNAQRIKELSSLTESSVPVDTHLVLSLTEKEIQMERSIRNFSTLAPQSLVFTKLDESWSYGEVFNQSSKWGVPISFFGIGQRIPDDIERASKERVIERIFGV